MTREFSAVVHQEGDFFVAQRLDVDVASQGSSEEEALANLQEALELFVQSPQATTASQSEQGPRRHRCRLGHSRSDRSIVDFERLAP